MSTLFELPDVGEGLTEADIVSWKVQPGDSVAVNQVLVEIETAKSLVELPSPQAGTVTKLLADEGQTVEVGTPIVEFDGTGDAAPSGDAPAQAGQDNPAGEAAAPSAIPAAAAATSAATTSPSADSSGDGPNLVGYGAKTAATKRRPRKASAVHAPAPGRTAASVRPLAKPPVRKLAKDRGIDLALVPATGARGEITRDDLLAFATAAPAGAAAPAAGLPDGVTHDTDDPAALEERIPFRGVTKAMAKAMSDSAFTAPHVTEFLDVDATGTMEFVRELKSNGTLGADVKVSPLAVVARAVIWAVARNPRINSCFDDQDILVKHYVNLGIAAATPRGLIVPNIKRADTLGLGGLAREIAELTATARAGKTTPAAQAGGTITITNVGVFGVDAGTPIINPGEAAIVAFGQIKPKPWVVDGQIVARQVTTLSVSADHRLVDGEVISKFLADLGRAIEDPRIMLV